MRVFVDMDGVLADFDTHYEALFGEKPDRILDNVKWNQVRQSKDFYLNIPPMEDMQLLWGYLSAKFGKLIVLTGIPSSVAEAADNKTAWVRKHLGDTEIICCLSKDKYRHCQPGDMLIDDWEKYRHLWEGAGGRWVTHTSAAETIRQIELLG